MGNMVVTAARLDGIATQIAGREKMDTPQIVAGTAVSTQNLSFAYRKGVPPVIDDLTLAFPASKMITLTGTSGSGKSTLLYLLALMIKPTGGAVLWDGVPASSLSDAQRSRLRATDVGFIFQDALLDPARSVIANVCDSALFSGMPRSLALPKAEELMEKFGVSHRAEHRPGEISGGQAQRVAICRALLTNPRVIFADEPTGNLDNESAEVVWGALKQHASTGATVVIATHNLELAALADIELRLHVNQPAELVHHGK